MSLAERHQGMQWIDEACAAGAPRDCACQVLALTVRTLQRWRHGDPVKADGRLAAARTPANKLSEAERQQILEVVNQPEFQRLPPSQIVPTLADQGCYIASESSFYPVLRQAAQLKPRGRAKAPTHRAAQGHRATGPNQVWSGDITYLATPLRGVFFYLYLIVGISSRKIVGWEVFEAESAEYAARVVQKACLREGMSAVPRVLHPDNGAPSKGATLLATLQRLGVMPSFSRPAVSNDNPYSEALFRTLKYHSTFPAQPFDRLPQARDWVWSFERWYNHQHKHSALNFLTPAQRHSGADAAILAQRKAVYEVAKARHPERWSKGIRTWDLAEGVWLNPPKSAPPEEASTLQAA